MQMRSRMGQSIYWVALIAGIAACSSPGPGSDAGAGGTPSDAAVPSTGGAAPSTTGGAGGASGGSPSVGTGGATPSGGTSSGGTSPSGTGGTPAVTGGAPGSGGEFTGSCTPSAAVRDASGSGPHDVVIETNSDPGIAEGTIYRPADLGGVEKYPIFVWGEGGCSLNGESNASAMAEIASHGYFVVADGTPGGEGNRSTNGDGGPLLAYVDWAIAENEKPCSAYYQSLDTTKVAANGFSCGGLMATGTAEDPRITTWGHTSSGLFGGSQSFYDAVDTPVLIVTGTDDELAYDNGVDDYEGIAAAGNVPVMLFAKEGAGHGGDLFQQDGGEFTAVILAWLNWWLKGDETATGKGALVGASCPYCSDSTWDVQSTNVE